MFNVENLKTLDSIKVEETINEKSKNININSTKIINYPVLDKTKTCGDCFYHDINLDRCLVYKVPTTKYSVGCEDHREF